MGLFGIGIDSLWVSFGLVWVAFGRGWVQFGTALGLVGFVFGFALGLLGLVWVGFGLGWVWFGFALAWAAGQPLISLKIQANTFPLKSFTFQDNICNLLLLGCSCSFWRLVWVGFRFGLVWFELALSRVGPNQTPASSPASLALP